MDIVGLIASFLMGTTLGILGGGGSILTVPILVYLFKITPAVATGYSLLIVGISSLMGGLVHIKKGNVNLGVAFLFALPSLVGVNVSRGLLLPNIPEVIADLGFLVLTKDIVVMISFAAIMVAASYTMIKSKAYKPRLEATSGTKPSRMILQGLIVGIIAGFVGAGGGFLILPSLVLLAGLSMRAAVGTSLVIIAFQSLLGFLGDVLRGYAMDWNLLLLVASFAVAGIFLGSVISSKFDEQKLKTAFGWFVLIMGISIILEQIKNLI